MRILLNFMTEPLGSSPPSYMLQADLMLRSTCRHSRTTPSVVCWWAVVPGPRTNSLIWFVLACNHILTERVFQENKKKRVFLDAHSLPFVSRLGRVIQSCLNSAVWALILDETLFSKTIQNSAQLDIPCRYLPHIAPGKFIGPCSHQVQWFRVVQKHNECLPSQVPHRPTLHTWLRSQLLLKSDCLPYIRHGIKLPRSRDSRQS